MTFARAVGFVVLLSFLVACSDEAPRTRSVGEAYVGPITLPLRKELTPNSPVSATVRHGDRLEILEYKRRFVRVRTPQGLEGWTDSRQLLTPEQMAELRRMSDDASHVPSQGAATVFEALNMHTEPNRYSPSFWQIPDNGKVDVIGHKLAVRAPAPPTAPAVQPLRPARRKSKEHSSQPKVAPPPLPPAPKPPDNWVALSVPKHEMIEPPKPESSKDAKKPAAPQPTDDWSLVRTKDGKVGWVLTRALNMAIPDEVAQYAEGHRITSYFALSTSKDGADVKNDWLWTTITKGLEPYEFDSFRVFVWSRKHHRYETAYIERNVTGHFPVEVDNSGSVPRFSLVLENDDGKLFRKTYTFEGYRVHMVAKAPYLASTESAAASKVASPPEQPAKQRSWYVRMKDRVRHWFH